jgi:uncharacterized protein (TIGR00251 family)
MSDLYIKEHENGITVKCRIQPGASKTALSGKYGEETLKFSVAAPPVDGKANKIFLLFLAKKLKIPKSAVTILNGEKSRTKTVFCRNIDIQTFNRTFNITN